LPSSRTGGGETAKAINDQVASGSVIEVQIIGGCRMAAIASGGAADCHRRHGEDGPRERPP